MSDAVTLPGLYRLLALERVDSVAAEAARRARAGAEEGTVVWARRQSGTDAGDRLSQPGPEGNLYCSILLRPDYPPTTGAEIGCVAAVGLAAALARAVSPMVVLEYRWPDEILLNEESVAWVSLTAAPVRDGQWAWLSVNATVNIAASGSLQRPGVLDLDGDAQIAPPSLLEDYSRQFLLWLNRWAERGLAPILTTWRRGLKGLDGATEIVLGGETVSGRFVRLDDDGSMVLQTETGRERRITLAEYYRLAAPAPESAS